MAVITNSKRSKPNRSRLWLFFAALAVGVGYGTWELTGSTIKGPQAPQLRPIPVVAALKGSDLFAMTKSEKITAAGKEIFMARCMPCHGANGEGGSGPNLADDYWLHGGGIMDLRKAVSDGIPEKGMIGWGIILSADQINSVVAFTWTLRGAITAKSKAPQGDLLDWEARQRLSLVQ